MTRTMVDSIDAGALPQGTTMCAGYLNGRWPSYDAMVQRFPDAVHVAIVVSAIDDGDVADVENGDLTPAQLAGWVRQRHAAGVARPCGYCNRSNLGAVDQALADAGIPAGGAVLWVATLDGTVVSGSSAHGYVIVACQNRSAGMNGGNYDSSVVFDDTWMPSPAPPASNSQPRTWPEDTMKATVATVSIALDANTGRIEGRLQLPLGLNAGEVINAWTINQTPAQAHYGPVPWCMGPDPTPDEQGCHGLLFSGELPGGRQCPAGSYGVIYWTPGS